MSLTTRTRPGLRAALSSVRGNRPFQLLWWSNLFFFGGAWGQTLVLGWIAYDLTRSEFLVAVFTAVKPVSCVPSSLTGGGVQVRASQGRRGRHIGSYID